MEFLIVLGVLVVIYLVTSYISRSYYPDETLKTDTFTTSVADTTLVLPRGNVSSPSDSSNTGSNQ